MASPHTDNIFKAIKDIEFKDTVSFQCGVTLNDSVEARAIADVLGRRPEIKVTFMPAMIRIDGDGKIIFKMNEISDELGYEMTAQLFEISASTHYGRMVMVDENTVILFGDMNEAMSYVAYA
jgi:propane monooxygenase coupling protein